MLTASRYKHLALWPLALALTTGCHIRLQGPTAGLAARPPQLPGPPKVDATQAALPRTLSHPQGGVVVHAIQAPNTRSFSIRWVAPHAARGAGIPPIPVDLLAETLRASVQERAVLLGHSWKVVAWADSLGLVLGVHAPTAQADAVVTALHATLHDGPSESALQAARASVLRTLQWADQGDLRSTHTHRQNAMRYGPEHPLGQALDKQVAAVNDTSMAQIKSMIATRVRARGSHLIFASAMSPQDTLQASAQLSWSTLPPPGPPPTLPGPLPAPREMPVEVYLVSVYPVVSMILDGAPVGPDLEAFEVVHAAWGLRWGRLFNAVRQQMGSAYAIQATYMPGLNTGQTLVYAQLDPENLRDGVLEIRAQWTRLVQQGLSLQEIRRAVTYLRGQTVAAADSAASAAAWATQEVLRGRDPAQAARRLARLQALTPDVVNAVIRRHIDPDRAHAVISFSRFGLVHGVGLGDVRHRAPRAL